MTNKNVVKYIHEAIELLKGEVRPLQSDVHERSVAHRFAVHMEQFFPGWDIDCEYNKHRNLIKRLEGVKQCDEQKTTDRIFPDIIVHKRTNNSPVQENLLAIEIKRDNACDPCDKKKLQLLTKRHGQFKYRLGLYIYLHDNQFTKTWYKGGRKVREEILLEQ